MYLTYGPHSPHLAHILAPINRGGTLPTLRMSTDEVSVAAKDASASDWILRHKELVAKNAERERREKELEAKRAAAKRRKQQEHDSYTSRDLEGLKVAHGFDELAVGEEIVLTLKDTSVLGKKKLHEIKDDEELELSEDELESIQLKELAKYKKIVEAKKKAKRPAYDVYNYDDDSTLLAQYDDDVDSSKEAGFRLGSEVESSALAQAMQRKLAEDLGEIAALDAALPAYLGGAGSTGVGEETGYAMYALSSDHLPPETEAPSFKKKKKKGGKFNSDETAAAADVAVPAKPLTLDDVVATTTDGISVQAEASGKPADVGSRASRKKPQLSSEPAVTSLSSSIATDSNAAAASSPTSSTGDNTADILQRRVALSDSNYLKALKKAEEETERMIRRAAASADVDALRGEEEEEYQSALKAQRLQQRLAAAAEARRKRQEFGRLMKERAEAMRLQQQQLQQESQQQHSTTQTQIKQEDEDFLSSHAARQDSNTQRGRIKFGGGSALDLVSTIGVNEDDEDESAAQAILRRIKEEAIHRIQDSQMTDAPVKLEPTSDPASVKAERTQEASASSTPPRYTTGSSTGPSTKRVKQYQVDENASDGEEERTRKVDISAIDTNVDVSQEGEEHFSLVEPKRKGGIAGILDRLREQGVLQKHKTTDDSDEEGGIVIRRTDDQGRELSTIEAWKYLSQHFHGQFSGLNKQEKLLRKKQEQERRLRAMGVELATARGSLDDLETNEEKQYKARVETKQAGIALSGEALRAQIMGNKRS